MTSGIQCNKCEKWFKRSDEIATEGKEPGWTTTAFHLCVACTKLLITTWLKSHGFRAENFKGVKYEGRSFDRS